MRCTPMRYMPVRYTYKKHARERGMPGLAELKLGNVAVQIGRIFHPRRARLPSYRCWRRQVLLRRQGRELVGLWRHHDNPGE